MYHFIVNPTAGAGRGYRIWKTLEKQLEHDSQEYRVFFTEAQGDATSIAKVLTSEREPAKILVVVGGEGTYNEVLNGISFKGLLTVSYIPAGFRNALSRGFQSLGRVRGQIRHLLHPKYFKMMDYGVLTCECDELFNRRFAGRCGIGLDAAICHNLTCCPTYYQFGRMHLYRCMNFVLGLKQLILAKPVKGYLLLDGTRKVEFNHIYFITFQVRREDKKKKKGQEFTDVEDGRLTVYVGNSAKKRKMIPILFDVIMGIRKKGSGVRIFECEEASVHLARPLAVHVDGESCMLQQNLEVRCIPGRIRMISARRTDS